MGGCGGCWWWGAFVCPQDRLRTQGERRREARRWGVGDAGVGDGDAPRRAPALGSRESGNDDGGMGGRRALLVSGAPFECPQQLLWMARGWGFQGVWWRTMALRMVRSLCMQATSATFLGLPWATSRS